MKRLYRSSENKIIAGVCGGLGEYYNIDPIIPRVIFFALMGVTGFAYIIMWIAVPKK